MNCMHGCVKIKETAALVFTSDLTFLSEAEEYQRQLDFFGGMLGICPLLNVDYEDI